MNILHGFWRPEATSQFVQGGKFFIWIESDDVAVGKRKSNFHHQHLSNETCLAFLKQTLEISLRDKNSTGFQTLLLPTAEGLPLAAPEFNLEQPDTAITLADWQVFCCHLPQPLKAINHLHFLCCYQVADTRIGSDLLFWYYFSQSLKDILYKDHYLPAILATQNGKNT